MKCTNFRLCSERTCHKVERLSTFPSIADKLIQRQLISETTYKNSVTFIETKTRSMKKVKLKKPKRCDRCETNLAAMASLRVFRALNMPLWLGGTRSANASQSTAFRATRRPAILMLKSKNKLLGKTTFKRTPQNKLQLFVLLCKYKLVAVRHQRGETKRREDITKSL